MIKIHSTKKLLAKLPLDEHGMLTNTGVNNNNPVADDSPLGDWHANLLTLQRHNCIVFVHDATRFPVFLKELRKPEFAELGWRFEDAFMNTLLKAGASDTQMQAAAGALRPLMFDSECSRSVQSTITQRAGDIEHIIARDNIALSQVSAYRMGAHLSEMLTKVKGMKDYIRPNEEMFALLDDLTKNTKANTRGIDADHKPPYEDSGNVVSIEKFRK